MDLRELLDTTVTGLGYELVLLELSPKGRLLRVFIDKPEKEGGVNVDDCVTVSNQLTRVLMVENIDYDRLEVSSPGLDRPLVKEADYARFAGQEVQIRLRVAKENRRNFNGILLRLQGGKVSLRTETGDVELDYDHIEKARLVPKFD
jgi:ribosome maturation factor RimP